MFWKNWFRRRDRRKHFRRHVPVLTLTIEDNKYRTVDWSLGGFAIRDFHRSLDVGDKLRGGIAPIGSEGHGEFDVRVRNIHEGIVGLMLTDISSANFLAMGGFRSR